MNLNTNSGVSWITLYLNLWRQKSWDSEFTRNKLDYYTKWNCQIAIDDYGTGYNNDAILLRLHPDYVKIDMSIVRNIDTDQNRQLMLQNLLSYLKYQQIKGICRGCGDICGDGNADFVWHRLPSGLIIPECPK